MRRIILTSSLLLLMLPFYSQKVSAIYKTEDLLKRLSSSDTVYLVNFWATWCKPCIEELPAFDSLYNSLKKDEKTVLLLVNLNFKDELEKTVNPFLKKKQVKTTCVLLDEVNGNVYIDKISPSWSGAIPATYIRRNGRSELFERKFTHNELQALIHRFKQD